MGAFESGTGLPGGVELAAVQFLSGRKRLQDAFAWNRHVEEGAFCGCDVFVPNQATILCSLGAASGTGAPHIRLLSMMLYRELNGIQLVLFHSTLIST